MPNVTIEVFADVVCPWCYIGERRLEQALEARPDLAFDWRWRPFQLQPRLPKEGLPWEVFAQAKFGGAERARAAFRQVASVGASEGLTFDFERVASAPNTTDAHRLMLFAQDTGRGREAVRMLFQAYFAEGADLNDLDTLAALGEQIGLEGAAVRTYLQSGRGAAAVMESQDQAARLGVTGVPFYVFDGRLALSGAQPKEVFLRALDRVRASETPAS